MGAKKIPLVELHAHLAASISPSVLWSIAHSYGIKLATRDYWDFLKLIILSKDRKTTLKKYLDEVYHPILDRIASGTFAVERAVHEAFGGAYRQNYITIMELRTNPMKHNLSGEQDLDHVIMAMLRGMDRALLEYPQIQAGLIFCLDRQFSLEKNIIIAEKAIKYRKRGIVGIDFSNYNKGSFHFRDYLGIVQKCKSFGLGITAHSGETADTDDMWELLEYINPQRIGHGIRAAYDKKLLKELAKRKIVLEICPLSNLATRAVENSEELKFILQTFIENKVLFTINTDWPELIEDAYLVNTFKFLLQKKILTDDQVENCLKIARISTFTQKKGLDAYL